MCETVVRSAFFFSFFFFWHGIPAIVIHEESLSNPGLLLSRPTPYQQAMGEVWSAGVRGSNQGRVTAVTDGGRNSSVGSVLGSLSCVMQLRGFDPPRSLR